MEIKAWLKEHQVKETSNGQFSLDGNNRIKINENELMAKMLSSGVMITSRDEFDETLVNYFDSTKANIEQCYAFPTFNTHLELIEWTLNLHEIRVTTSGLLVDKFGKSCDYKLTVQTCGLVAKDHSFETSKDAPRPTWTSEHIKAAFDVYLWEKAQQAEEEWRNKICYSEDADAQYLDNWLDWFLGAYKVKTDHDLSKAMIKQWMWQVKRYVFNLRVTDPYFVNVFGVNQGTGKTEFIKTLTECIQPYRIEAAVDDALDGRNSKMWSQFYVVIMDELKVNSDSDAGKMASVLKNLLTSDELNFRELGTHTINKDRRVFSAFGTSNMSVVDVIKDESGMRRFFEIDIDVKNRDSNDGRERVGTWKTADHLMMWKSINENDDYGMLTDGLKRKLAEVQATYRRKTYLSMWITDKHNPLKNLLNTSVLDWETWEDVDQDLALEHEVGEMFIDFKQWLDEIDHQYAMKYPVTVNRFEQQLKSEGLIIIEDEKGVSYGFTKNKPKKK